VTSKETLKIYKSLTKSKPAAPLLKIQKKNPVLAVLPNQRPNAVCVEDVFFGDSGKGSVVAKFNEMLKAGRGKKKLISLRYNGGGNAGHESLVNGKLVVTHQLPMGIIKDGSTTIISRGMLIHPEDLLTEIKEVKSTFGGTLPGELVIDERTPLTLDTHRALETALNSVTSGGKGSTGRGIATGYASFYERIVVTIKDLMAQNWKDTFTKHYTLYKSLTAGFSNSETNFELAKIPVATYSKEKGEKRTVGTEKEFLERLESARSSIKKYVSKDVYSILKEAWENPAIPFTLEGAQGAGLEAFLTASGHALTPS